VRDVEALCWSVVDRSRLKLNHHDRADLTTYLIETCWVLSERFEPGGIKFSTFATNTLRFRLVDWQRSRNGRTKWSFAGFTYERVQPQLVSLDADDSLSDRLGSSLAGSGLDDGEPRLSDELRALDKRSSRPGRREDWLGDEAAQRVASRD